MFLAGCAYFAGCVAQSDCLGADCGAAAVFEAIVSARLPGMAA